MRMWLVALVACVDAPGDTGPDTPGAPIVVAAPYHWVDADGSEAVASPGLIHFDGDGYAWQVNPETGEIRVPDAPVMYYPTADCGGPAHIAPRTPRQPFLFAGRWHVRGDTVAAREICPESYDDGDGSCPDWNGGCLDLVPWDGVTTLPVDFEPPVLGLRPPLRMEPLE